MELGFLDMSIIAAYLALSVAIGFWVAGRASKSIKSYFLGGNQMPWWALGLSNASGMFDISGTMWMVYLLFIYGLKSIWIPWLWPTFNQIFLMMFLSAWLRRSNVMTGAEWIVFRFGEGTGARLSHIIVVIFALLTVLGYLAYGFVGIGKFAAAFLPFELSVDPRMNEIGYGLLFVGITALYVIKGGMFSVVTTEVMQFFIMLIACIAIAWIAIDRVSPEMVAAATPEGWSSPWFGHHVGLDWRGILDSANARIIEDGWSMFSVFFMLVLFKGVMQSLAGPAPNYDMQRILSARTPAEASKMSALVNVVLLPARYLMITGLTILALAFFLPELRAMGPDVDFELILPFAIREFVPAGLLGLLIAGLLAAFMSSFAATVNAAPAYVVNDLYKRYIRPDASKQTYVRMSYLVSTVFVILGTGIGLFVPSLNNVILWIVAALYGGYTASNVLKWYWWRFNGHGYFWGMAAGIAMAVPLALTDWSPLYFFPIMLLVTGISAVVATLMTAPTDMETLKVFYIRTRPWGFWGPVREALQDDRSKIPANEDFKIDFFNVVTGIAWQTALITAAIYLVLQDTFRMQIALTIALILTVALKFTWYDRLNRQDEIAAEADIADSSSNAKFAEN
jgi:Na+/proline symporter